MPVGVLVAVEEYPLKKPPEFGLPLAIKAPAPDALITKLFALLSGYPLNGERLPTTIAVRLGADAGGLGILKPQDLVPNEVYPPLTE
jgi:hypothetical protein